MGRRKGSPPTGGSFKKGKSGNPGGRPKGLASFRKSLSPLEGVALKQLKALVTDTDPRVSLDAVKHVHAYLYGRPAQAVELTGKNGAPIESETKATVTHEKPATAEQLGEVVRLLVVSGAVALPGATGALPGGADATQDEVLDSQPDASADRVPVAAVP